MECAPSTLSSALPPKLTSQERENHDCLIKRGQKGHKRAQLTATGPLLVRAKLQGVSSRLNILTNRPAELDQADRKLEREIAEEDVGKRMCQGN